ncbi:hypothetical protein [Carboxylicivirga caseinilyticus]|uniref:hypothetical protein n=1 Tax=Carboxylicivirga caseinilyticus TaxID=3417572 RepID=UPI003D328144|nr:hypothetical protein [Marinilabiliaceae bacterium A049]
MKKFAFKVLALAAIAAPLFSSCDDNNNPVPSKDEVIENLESGVMEGTLNEDYTLSMSQYQLTGAFIISEGVTLTIPEGTQIVAEAGGTEVYVAVLMGGKIKINGTASNPVVMSSPNAVPGDWGGLTLCGKGVSTSGANSTAEVGGFIYGGDDNTDSSGSIEYLVIKGTGAQINEESQYNGVSFYTVGSGTTVNNIAVINGSDDGVEFFGGAVEVTNIFLQNNEDDAIDWTEGWSGSVTNAYIEHTIEGFSTAFEGDKENNNPTFTNITAISTTGGTALQFKSVSGGTITGLYLSGYAVDLDMKDDGELSAVQIEGADADATLIVDETHKYLLNSGKDAQPLDISGWTWIDAEVAEVVELNGDVTGDVTLDASKYYRLSGAYIVQDGAKLTIPEGTKIHADAGGTEVYIAVLMGGEIDIQGTNTNPVILSSADANPGDWGGLTICGKGVTTSGANSVAEVGGFVYGGNDNADNSGSITYLVIKGTGAQINEESQYNGVSLYAVGSGTTLENIAVINGADDGVEFFGGAAMVTNIYLENNEDDAVDWTEGWSGGIVNTYISHTIEGFSTAFEGDKENNNPTFENVTAICTTSGTGLQFKSVSGGTITGLHMEGYTVDLDMKDSGDLANVQINGAAADATLITGETHKYTLNSGKDSNAIDISGWTWISASF